MKSLYTWRRETSRFRTMHSLLLCLMCVAPFNAPTHAQPLPAAEVKSAVKTMWERDAERAVRYRASLHAFLKTLKSRPELSKPGADGLLTRAQKEALWTEWSSALDYLYGLESIRKQYRRYYKSDVPSSISRKAFMLSYGALVMSYVFIVQLAQWSQASSEAVSVALNEAVQEFGLRPKSLDELLSAYLNPKLAMEITIKDVKYRFFTRKGELKFIPKSFRDPLRADRRLVSMIKDHGASILTLKHAFDQLKKDTLETIFPLQANISEWMGDTKIKHPKSRINAEQIHALVDRLEVGDVLLERREWYLSNIGLPGFWPHAALYVGVPAQWSAFDQDPSVSEWVRKHGEVTGRFSALIQSHFPDAYKRHMEPEKGHERRVIEAMSEGVSHTSLEHSADCDSLLVLRPRVTTLAKARALYRAFYYSGRPYDFDFNFLTDQTLVCTEVIERAYEPESVSGVVQKGDGIAFSTVKVMGRDVIPANHIAKIFSMSYEGPEEERPFDFVLFYDGDVEGKHAAEGTLEQAKQSWKRPKWRWK